MTRQARPLDVLIPLIKQDLEAANKPVEPFYRGAGELLWEARTQIPDDHWEPWLQRNFGIGQKTAASYMRFAALHHGSQSHKP